ncbi:MAG: thioredoxin family protein [Thermodesulfobacteriota bacterium]|nr:thioredoxin family protein [Thermodesulfobacteriota bacterium]
MFIELTDETFRGHAASNSLVLLFTSPWCAGCKKVKKALESIALKQEDQDRAIQFAQIDISRSPDTPAGLGVISLPTVIIFKEGKEVSRFSGSIRPKALTVEVERL